jgi:hypothetical protein
MKELGKVTTGSWNAENVVSVFNAGLKIDVPDYSL